MNEFGIAPDSFFSVYLKSVVIFCTIHKKGTEGDILSDDDLYNKFTLVDIENCKYKFYLIYQNDFTNGKVKLTVRDTGIGIPSREQSRVFERFYRVDKSHSKLVGGTRLILIDHTLWIIQIITINCTK